MAGESGPAVAAPATAQTQAHAESGEQAGGGHEGGMLQPWYMRGPIPPVASGTAAPTKPTASEQAYGAHPEEAHSLDVTPERHRFEPVEVGAVSDPLTVVFANHRTDAIELDRVELRSKDFDLITPFEPELMSAGSQLALEVALRPTQVGNVQGHLTLFGHTRDGSKVSRGLTLLGTGAKPKAENADRRELSVAKRNARNLERAREAPSTSTYAEMLAAVLAAQDLTKREDDDDRRHAELLLKSVQKRMDELEPISSEKLRGMGFGNTTGHLIFDGAKSAVDMWIRKLAMGASIATDPLVAQFRVGAEAIRLCTGERKDAPNLEKVGEVGKQTAEIGIAAIAALPAVGVLIEEAGLVVFTTRLAGQRVLTWALLNPAQALAASEALLGFGVQIGQDGWDTFWDQLHDPRGFMYIAMQIAMDVMHVQSAGGGRSSPQAPHEPSPKEIGEIKTRLQSVRQTLESVEEQVTANESTTAKAAGAGTSRSTAERVVDERAQRSPSTQSTAAIRDEGIDNTPRAQANARVNTPVQGVYESIDPSGPAPQGWEFQDYRMRGGSLYTEIKAPNGATGHVWRNYDPALKQWVMKEAFFSNEMPAWIETGAPMVKGKGTPLIAYLDMRVMKTYDIAYGSLRSVKLTTIQNVEAVCELEAQRRAGIDLHDAVRNTASVRYAETEVVQSGHQIVDVKLSGGRRTPIERMLTHYENSGFRTKANHDAILQKYRISRSDEVLWDYDIEIDLAPFAGGNR